MVYLRRKSMVIYLVKPLFVALLLFGIFGIIWLRSNLISLEYTISELENKRMERLRETKMLMAERASMLSIQRVEGTAVRDLGLVFPDRTRVVYVKDRGAGPQMVSGRFR